MKKIILLLAVTVVTAKTFSQTIQPAYSKDYYLQKSRNQKTTAWILLSGGTVMAVVGGITFNNNFDLGSNKEIDTPGFIMLGGVLADIASIPFFISAAKNKRKAASIVFTHQNNYILVQNKAVLINLLAISLQLRF